MHSSMMNFHYLRARARACVCVCVCVCVTCMFKILWLLSIILNKYSSREYYGEYYA